MKKRILNWALWLLIGLAWTILVIGAMYMFIIEIISTGY